MKGTSEADLLKSACKLERLVLVLCSIRFHQWLQTTLAVVSKKSEIAAAIRYALSRWRARLRYCEDSHIELDNNAAERALRAVGLERKNYLFAGSDSGGERAAG